jgi:small subunit ribosomal protein S11
LELLCLGLQRVTWVSKVLVKGTPYAAQLTAEDAAKKAMESGMKSVDVYLTGPGAGREPAIRALAAAGMRVLSLKDVTPVPHNGCRPPKRRRI